MSRYWNPELSALSPYVPGEQPKMDKLLKLNTNELPWGPSPAALEAMRTACNDNLRLYPDPDSSALGRAFAEQVGLSEAQVFVGNGSDEVLAHTFKALFQPSAAVLFPDISYSFYPVYCRFFGLQQETVALDDNFEIRLGDYERENGGIIFPNPNAPTGIGLPLAPIEALLVANPDTVVVVDEAYIDFGGCSATALVDRFPNLLVIQTLSKSRALAGLRVGVAFGQEELIAGLSRVKNSFNSYPLDRLSQVGAIAALEDERWFRESCERLINSRELLRADLLALGFGVLPSQANFLFASHPGQSALSLHRALRQRGILVRHFTQARIENFLRISIGTAEQNATLVAALREILELL
jgi:histidinol-phosphate aminotransferase